MAEADHESVKGKDPIMWYEKDHPPNPVRYQSNCPKKATKRICNRVAARRIHMPT